MQKIDGIGVIIFCQHGTTGNVTNNKHYTHTPSAVKYKLLLFPKTTIPFQLEAQRGGEKKTIEISL
jgi:hypothetical protein